MFNDLKSSCILTLYISNLGSPLISMNIRCEHPETHSYPSGLWFCTFVLCCRWEPGRHLYHPSTGVPSNDLTTQKSHWEPHKCSAKPKLNVSLPQLPLAQMLKYLRPVQSCWMRGDVEGKVRVEWDSDLHQMHLTHLTFPNSTIFYKNIQSCKHSARPSPKGLWKVGVRILCLASFMVNLPQSFRTGNGTCNDLSPPPLCVWGLRRGGERDQV